MANSNSNSNNSDNINRGAGDGLEKFARENCLMLLATKAAAIAAAAIAKQEVVSGEDDDVECKYPCRTCGRTFKSFQALGGHRASHVKPKSTVDDGSDASSGEPVKPKTFQCSTCGVEFGTGQALGGHMRCHRSRIPAFSTNTSSSVTTEEDSNIKKQIKKRKNDVITPVLKKLSSSTKRVCLELTLDYAPEKVQQHVDDIEQGEMVEQEDDNYDFLKLELRQPIRN
ncbi:uncharacterized protein LOC141621238 [Silene latifolia]|uniref:uncharacterized protein LOC141621238 n=1 Tax=Silene latifolia TaxID=37657 RepID=UPI003D77C28C